MEKFFNCDIYNPCYRIECKTSYTTEPDETISIKEVLKHIEMLKYMITNVTIIKVEVSGYFPNSYLRREFTEVDLEKTNNTKICIHNGKDKFITEKQTEIEINRVKIYYKQED